MSNYLMKASTKSISKSPFYKPGILGRIYRYIAFYRSSAKGYTDREGLPYKIRES
jgi:hypothetical protein